MRKEEKNGAEVLGAKKKAIKCSIYNNPASQWRLTNLILEKLDHIQKRSEIGCFYNEGEEFKNFSPSELNLKKERELCKK